MLKNLLNQRNLRENKVQPVQLVKYKHSNISLKFRNYAKDF